MTERFVTAIRTRGEAIRLAPADATETWTIRAQVHEAWDAIRVVVLPGTPVADVKRVALDVLLNGTADADAYMTKVYGTEVQRESESLEACGVTNGGTVFVHTRRRRPVR